MSDSLVIQIRSERITISSIAGKMLLDGPSIIAFDENDNILGIGESLESLQNKSKADKKQLASNIKFSNPFLLNTFEPKLAAMVICYSVYAVFNPPLEIQPKTPVHEREWDVHIPGYESLEIKIQDLFEFYLQAFSVASPKELTINNVIKKIGRFNWAINTVKASLGITVWGTLYLTWQLTRNLVKEHMSQPVTFPSFILTMVGFMVAVYFSGLLSIKIGKVAFRKLIPYPVYKAMLEDVYFPTPKDLISSLKQKISSKK